jgi:hypothetical protein
MRSNRPSSRNREELAAAIAALERPARVAARLVRTGWDAMDRVLLPLESVGVWSGAGGLPCGCVHEWFGDAAERPNWLPPLTVLSHLARRAARVASDASRGAEIVWIGARCWPYPVALARGEALERHLFVDAPTCDQRVWATELALRSRGVACVVADASGLKMSDTRRLQLAAAESGGIAFLARPPWERRELSAAATRWLATPQPGADSAVCFPDPHWRLELLRCKGLRPVPEDARSWIVRLDHATGDVHLVADAAGRRAAPTRQSA